MKLSDSAGMDAPRAWQVVDPDNRGPIIGRWWVPSTNIGVGNGPADIARVGFDWA